MEETVKAAATVAPRVIKSDPVTKLPGQVIPSPVELNMEADPDCGLNINKDTVVYLIYLLFKTNMIARNNLRNMLDVVSKPVPKDVLKWMVNEAAKAGR